MDSIRRTTSSYNLFILFQLLIVGVFLLLFVSLYIYAIKMSNFIFDIISLFVDVSNKDIKVQIKKG